MKPNKCPFLFQLAIIINLLLCTSCKKDDTGIYNSSIDISNTKKYLTEYLNNYTSIYTSLYYNANNADISAENINSELLKIYNFSYRTKSPSSNYEDQNILTSYKDNLSRILSSEAMALLESFIGNGFNNQIEYAELKKSIAYLSNSDKSVLNNILEISDLFKDYFQNSLYTNTKAVSGLSCNILYSILGTMTGSIWAAAFAGPVGWCIGAAWGIASTVVAYYEC